MPRAARAAAAAAVTTALLAAGCSSSEPDEVTELEPTEEPSTEPATAETMGDPTTGVSDDAVRFGQSAAFSGPAAQLGIEMNNGIRAAFEEVNAAGGVHGRRLELVSLDDFYEPEAAIANTRRLIESEQVFALIGAVGTPTSRSATPVAAESGVPYIAPFTGAAFLRDPQWDNIINLRASYNQETEEMVERLVTDLGTQRIAIMYQDDSFGRAGYRGARSALQRRDMEPVSLGLYQRNTTAVRSGLLDVRLGDPEAVIVIGAYQPVAEVIKWAHILDMDAIFMTVSFVGSNALVSELGDEPAEGVYITQVVPFPTDSDVPVIAAYLSALERHAPDVEPGFVSAEGYLAGRLAVAGLEGCGPDLDRACFLESFRGVDAFDLDGFDVDFGTMDNQGSDAVFLTTIDAQGRLRSIETLTDDVG